MLRTAIVCIECDLSDKEFEKWLRQGLRNISIHPNKTQVDVIPKESILSPVILKHIEKYS